MRVLPILNKGVRGMRVLPILNKGLKPIVKEYGYFVASLAT